jgi:flagellar hook-associated protein 3 FlgL
MVTSIDAASELFLADLSRAQARMADAQRQVSSGKKIVNASDSPDQIDSLLQLRAAQAHNTQIQSNLGRAKTEADTAETTLESSMKLMDRALVLAGQAANTTQSVDTRNSIAGEVKSILEQLVSFTKTTVQGRMIFSGDSDQSAGYQVNWSSPTGVDRLFPMVATRRVEDPAGGTFAVAKTAQDIFDHRNSDDTVAQDNVFNALATLNTALVNNDTTGINSAITMIHQSSNYLNSATAFYGSVQTRIQDGLDFSTKYDTQLKSEISATEDADISAAALEMTQANTQIQAALQARAKLPHTSLFDLMG